MHERQAAQHRAFDNSELRCPRVLTHIQVDVVEVARSCGSLVEGKHHETEHEDDAEDEHRPLGRRGHATRSEALLARVAAGAI